MRTQAQLSQLEVSAAALAVRLAGFSELTETFQENISRRKEDKRSSFAIHGFLAENFLEEDRAAWPVVGSKEKDDLGNLVNNPDIIEYTDLNGTTKTFSFWKAVANKHPVGNFHQTELAKITDASKPQPARNEYTDMPKHVREDKRREHQQAFTTFFGNLREAVALFDAMAQGNTVPDVQVEYTMTQARDDKGNIIMENGKAVMAPADTAQVITVRSISDPSMAKCFTVTNFLRLDADKAKTDGGGYTHYITSNARGTGDDTPKTLSIKTVSEFEAATAAAVNFLEVVKANPAAIAGLVKHYKGKDSDDRLMTLANLVELASIVTEVPELKARINNLLVAGHTVGQKAAA